MKNCLLQWFSSDLNFQILCTSGHRLSVTMVWLQAHGYPNSAKPVFQTGYLEPFLLPISELVIKDLIYSQVKLTQPVPVQVQLLCTLCSGCGLNLIFVNICFKRF